VSLRTSLYPPSSNVDSPSKGLKSTAAPRRLSIFCINTDCPLTFSCEPTLFSHWYPTIDYSVQSPPTAPRLMRPRAGLKVAHRVVHGRNRPLVDKLRLPMCSTAPSQQATSMKVSQSPVLFAEPARCDACHINHLHIDCRCMTTPSLLRAIRSS